MSEPQPGVVEIASATPIGSVAENRPGLEPVRGNGEGVSMKRTAVLVPCYNEEVTVAKVVTDFRAALPDADVYVYDNNSTDRTAEIVTALAANDPQVHLRHEYRQGKGNVIHAMFRDIDADCYVMIDGDDTYPAEHAPEMAQLILDGKADMVIGDRLSTTYGSENKRAFHGLGNSMVRSLINSLFNSKINDIMTGYRAFSRSFVKGFPVLSRGFEIETEMSIHAVDKNLRLLEVPITYRDRPEGSDSKLNTYSDGFKVLRTIFRLFREYKPMTFFSTLAVLMLLVGAGLLVPVLIDYFQTGLVPRFPSLIVSVSLAGMALLAWGIGMILDVEVKKHRQLYEVVTNYHEHLARLAMERKK